MRIHVYTSGDELPAGLLTENIFHSPALFKLSKETPRHKPYLATVEREDGTIMGQLLAMVRYRSSLFPPYFYMHGRIFGEGAYRQELSTEEKQSLFGMMLKELRSSMGLKVLYIEVSNLSQKMFGYREFRQTSFFPIRWMSIHNSLHSKPPIARLSNRMKELINDSYQKGVVTEQLTKEEDLHTFTKLLRHHNWLKPKRYIPQDNFFRGIMKSKTGSLFVTKYKHHVIGCSVVVYSQGQAYLWYSAFRRKTFRWLHPAELTIWHALDNAHQRGFQHMFFMDVGLPFSKNPFREFILRFGGKPVSTYRWFYINIRWLNRLFSWIYRE